MLKVQANRFDLGTGSHVLIQKLQYHAGNTPVGLLGPLETSVSGLLPHLKLPDIGQAKLV